MNIVLLSSTPSRAEEVSRLNDSSWPEFLLHGDVRNWSSLYTKFADFQLLFLEQEALVGAGLTVPCAWHPDLPTPETLDEVVYRARWPLEQGSLCALAALVAPSHRKRGLSREIIMAMMELAGRRGLCGVIAPVRPTRKHEFPFEPIEEYLLRRDEQNRVWDPWVRVHAELGGLRLGIATAAVRVRGTVAEWEEWTGERFSESGDVAVPGGLVPVSVDREADVGEYREPNVWYFHARRA
jgi:GNAT superfamily N-acetyltransferase